MFKIVYNGVKKKLYVLLFILYFCLPCLPLYAQQGISITDLYQLELAGRQVLVLEDRAGKLSIEDIQKPENQALFKSYHKNIFTKPPSNHTTWFKITVANHTSEDVWVNLASVTPWYIDFYARDTEAGKYILKAQTGMMRPSKNKQYPANNFWLPLVEEGRQGFQTFYISVKSERTIELPIYIGTLHALHKQNTQRDFIVAGFMGIMLITFFYNISLYAVVKDKIYLIYSIHLCLVSFGTAYLNSYSFLHWLSFVPFQFWQTYLYVWVPISSVCICLFALSYLELKRNLPAFYYAVVGLMILHGIVFPCLNIFFFRVVHLSIPYQLVSLMTYVICLLAGFILHFRKNKNASYYILGWSFVIFGVFMYLFTVNGFLPLNIITENGLIFGITSEVVLFSFALGDRVNQIRKQNDRLVKEQNALLERKVNERTLELKELNHTKDKLFAIIGHDLKSPIHSLKSLLDLLANQNITIEEFMQFSQNLKNGVEHIHFTLNNLLQWANSQMQGIEVNPQKIDLQLLAQENVELFEEIALKKQLTLSNEILPAQCAWADEDQINLVLRNLISNALKFTPSGGKITLQSRQDSTKNALVVSIKDTGKGIAPEYIAQLFKAHQTTYGTAGEKGTGLGLSLCQDFIVRNAGTLWVESTVGSGSTFYFALPTTLSPMLTI